MSSIHSTANDCADEHITLDDLLLIEDAYYYNENASEPSEDFADHRDQEMLEANAVPNCEVRIEPLPVGDEDDEGNTIDSDELDYDGLGISDEYEEESQRSAGDGNWKSNYAKWMSNYKIPITRMKATTHNDTKEYEVRSKQVQTTVTHDSNA
ncbi:hypothetical protein AAVH_27797 [Aphelenchoides avenae]|nr:hypothetical protein AAVH_27797 [Aphelenchus avenae]